MNSPLQNIFIHFKRYIKKNVYQNPSSLYTVNPHIIQLQTWLTLLCRRGAKDQIISRELWDSLSVSGLESKQQ